MSHVHHGHAHGCGRRSVIGLVERLGRRPQSVAERAAAILDDDGRREGAE